MPIDAPGDGSQSARSASPTHTAAPRTRQVIGVMTGTSIDGLDAALVAIDGTGLAIRARLVRAIAASFPTDLARRLRDAAEQRPLSVGELARLSLDFGEFHAAALEPLARGETVDLIVAHGQTVFHSPPVSLQLLTPAPIVRALATTVVCDLRQVDLACGGQGAPITPLADWVLFRAPHPRAVLNLGGFANATILPGDDVRAIRGFDLCACNHVLDRVARQALGSPYDDSGGAACRGTPHEPSVQVLVDALLRQRTSGRSLGTGDEAGEWVDRLVSTLRPEDLAASAASGVGHAIGRALADAGLPRDADVVVAGGGARHRMLVATLARATGRPTRVSDDVGVPAAARESMAMAVLGAIADDGLPITLEAVTGRVPHRAIDGAWWRASGAVRRADQPAVTTP